MRALLSTFCLFLAGLSPLLQEPTPASKPASAPRSSEKAMLKVGDVAPDFRVQDHTGKERTLSEFKGKRVVLWFYPKADTPGCTAEGCGFRDNFTEYEKRGVQVLGVSFDTPAENAAFVKKFSFPFPLLCDVKREIGVAYGAAPDKNAKYAERISYVIGPDGKIEQAIGKVQAKSHPTELLGTLPGAKNR